MRKIAIAFLLTLFSLSAIADIQQRIYFFNQQSEIFHRICFNEKGEFTNVKYWDARSTDTSFDCRAQAHALNEEADAIDKAMTALGGDSCTLDVTNPELAALMNGGTAAAGGLACPGAGSTADCLKNMSCNIVQSMLPAGSYLTRLVEKTADVNLGCSKNDGGMNCGSAIGNAILDSLWDNVTGLCWLATLGNFCNGDSKTDPESMTDVRAAAASAQDDGALAQFKSDPLGFIKKVVNTIVETIKNTVKTRYACSEWAGLPGLSACKTPIDELSWECQDCSQRMNMICGVGGYVGSEVITIFFTGGITGGVRALTEVLQQSSNAAKIAKLVSESKIGKVAIQGARVGSKLGQWAGKKLGDLWKGIKSLPPYVSIKELSTKLRIMGAGLMLSAQEIRIFSKTQDGFAALAKQFNQFAKAGHDLGYNATYRAFGKTRNEVVEGWPPYVDKAGAEALLAKYQKDYPDYQSTLSIRKVDVPKEGGGYRQIVVIVNDQGIPVTDTIRLRPHVAVVQPPKPETPPGIQVVNPPRVVKLSPMADNTIKASTERIMAAPLPSSNKYKYRALDEIKNVRDPKLQSGLEAGVEAMYERKKVADYIKKLHEDTFKVMLESGHRDLILKANLGQLDAGAMESVLRLRAKQKGVGVSTIPKNAGQLDDAKFMEKLRGGYLIDRAFADKAHGSYSHMIQQDFTYDIIAKSSGKTHREIAHFFGSPEGVKVWSKMYDVADGVPGHQIGPVQVEEFRRIYLQDIPLDNPLD